MFGAVPWTLSLVVLLHWGHAELKKTTYCGDPPTHMAAPPLPDQVGYDWVRESYTVVASRNYSPGQEVMGWSCAPCWL